MSLLQALGWDTGGHYALSNLLPLGLMLAASVIWRGWAGRRSHGESLGQVASRDLELMLVCLLFNAAALLAWSLLRPSAPLLRLWAAHALLGAMPNLWPRPLRAWRWPTVYTLLAGGTLLLGA